MAKDFARKFYHSAAWQKVRQLALIKCDKICEVEGCEEPAYIVHHIIELEPGNMDDPFITLSLDNLRCVCLRHHNMEHKVGDERNTVDGLMFDKDGSIIKREMIIYKEREEI